MENEITEELRRFLEKRRLIRKGLQIELDQDLLDSGIIDSLAIMELSRHIEYTYDVRVSEDDLVPENFCSLNAITAYIREKKQLA